MDKDKKFRSIFIKQMLFDIFRQLLVTIIPIVIMVIVASALSYLLYGNIELSRAVLIVGLIASLFVGFLIGLQNLFIYIKIYPQARDAPNPITLWLDENHVEFTFDIRRSSDGTRQMRMTRADGIEHYHLEILDADTDFVLENNVCGDLKTDADADSGIRLIAKVSDKNISSPTAHYLGFPPIMREGEDSRTLLPPAHILLIEQRKIDIFLFRLFRSRILLNEQKKSDIFLFRFTAEGEYAGDTWHQSIEEAKKQAVFEYQLASNVWETVPDDIDDVIQVVLGNGRD